MGNSLGPMLSSREMPILATTWVCSFGYTASPDLQTISQGTSRFLCGFASPYADGTVKGPLGAQCGPGSPGTTEAEWALVRLLPEVPDGQIDMPMTLSWSSVQAEVGMAISSTIQTPRVFKLVLGWKMMIKTVP